LAIPSIGRGKRNEIISQLEHYPVQVRTMPSMDELAEGRAKIEDIREVFIEDLIGRDPVPPIQTLLKLNVTDKSVMITGAGGSIGSEICRQLIKIKPKCMVLIEHNEYSLYTIQMELENINNVKLIPILGSITNKSFVENALIKYEVQTVYHAAAYKHVSLVESNIIEAARNNILGTNLLAQASISTKVETMVLISSDKAVRPTSIMGVTKRFSELILQGLSKKSGCRFINCYKTW